MSANEILVLVGGLAVIIAINWYFFAPQKGAVSARTDGIQLVEIEVRGGYNPGTVRVKRGVPLRLVFNRQEEAPCSEEIVIPAFGVRKFLAPFARTSVDVTPHTSGKFAMTCGMSMLHGTLVVED
jgi:plastocyanin domain-containing protein